MIPDKRVWTVSNIILWEIFPRYGVPKQLVTDNGSENVNQIMEETPRGLNTIHITTSPYHPQSNVKVERFHRTLTDVLAKLTGYNKDSWDEYLTQVLAAVRFSMNKTTKFSPYYMLFGRDVVLPIDNLLRPRRKYMGEEHHKLISEQQHKIFFTQVRRKIRRAQKRCNDKINQNRKKINFQVGDPVHYQVHLREGKLDRRWISLYRIVEQTRPIT